MQRRRRKKQPFLEIRNETSFFFSFFCSFGCSFVLLQIIALIYTIYILKSISIEHGIHTLARAHITQRNAHTKSGYIVVANEMSNIINLLVARGQMILFL